MEDEQISDTSGEKTSEYYLNVYRSYLNSDNNFMKYYQISKVFSAVERNETLLDVLVNTFIKENFSDSFYTNFLTYLQEIFKLFENILMLDAKKHYYLLKSSKNHLDFANNFLKKYFEFYGYKYDNNLEISAVLAIFSYLISGNDDRNMFIMPENPEPIVYLAIIDLIGEKFKAATDKLASVQEINGYAAYLLYKNNSDKPALKNIILEKACRLNYHEALREMGRKYVHDPSIRDDSKAINYFKKCLDVNPQDSRALYNLGIMTRDNNYLLRAKELGLVISGHRYLINVHCQARKSVDSCIFNKVPFSRRFGYYHAYRHGFDDTDFTLFYLATGGLGLVAHAVYFVTCGLRFEIASVDTLAELQKYRDYYLISERLDDIYKLYECSREHECIGNLIKTLRESEMINDKTMSAALEKAKISLGESIIYGGIDMVVTYLNIDTRENAIIIMLICMLQILIDKFCQNRTDQVYETFHKIKNYNYNNLVKYFLINSYKLAKTFKKMIKAINNEISHERYKFGSDIYLEAKDHFEKHANIKSS